MTPPERSDIRARILRVLARARKSLMTGELAHRAGVYEHDVYRVLPTLVSEGIVERDRSTIDPTWRRCR